MSTYQLVLEGKRHVSIDERDGGLMITETKIDTKRKTSKERWIARVNCPGEKVQLGRMAEIEKLQSKGYVVEGDSDSQPDTPPGPDGYIYYRGAFKGLTALRATLRAPESIPGITFEAVPEGWWLLDDERDPEADPYQDRIVLPDEGNKAMVCWTGKGSAMYGVLLALAKEGHGTLTVEVGDSLSTLDAGDLKREIHTATGKVRASLEAMGAIEPQSRDYAKAIGSAQSEHLVL